MDEPVLITPDEIAVEMNKPKWKIYQLLRAGALPALRKNGGKTYEIPREAYRRVMRGEPVDARLFERPQTATRRRG